MRTRLAWANIAHRKTRSMTAVMGIAMAIILIFLQLGFYRASFDSSLKVFDQLAYDIVLVASEYVIIRDSGFVNKHRLIQAEAVPGVSQVTPLYVGVGLWQDPVSKAKREVLILGVDPDDSPFKSGELNQRVRGLRLPDTAIMDRKRGAGYEGLDARAVDLSGKRINMIDGYTHGAGFVANASVIVSDATFRGVMKGVSLDHVTVGLVSLEPGASAEEVKARLEAVLPDDVRVRTRAVHEAKEQEFYVYEKPIGIIFTTGLLLALIVGAVILFQVLSADILNHLREYATLKGIGYTRFRIKFIVMQQATLFALLAFVPSALISFGIYEMIRANTNLPTTMTLQRILVVLILSLVMCWTAGLIAVRKIDKADPADLF